MTLFFDVEIPTLQLLLGNCCLAATFQQQHELLKEKNTVKTQKSGRKTRVMSQQKVQYNLLTERELIGALDRMGIPQGGAVFNMKPWLEDLERTMGVANFESRLETAFKEEIRLDKENAHPRVKQCVALYKPRSSDGVVNYLFKEELGANATRLLRAV